MRLRCARFSSSETGILGADPELRILDPAAFACQAMMRPPWPYPISFGFFSSGESTRVMGPKGAAFYQSSASTTMDCSPAVLLLLFHFFWAVK